MKKRILRKRKKRIQFIIASIALILLVSILAIYFIQSFLFPSILTIPELSTLGYNEVSIGVNVTDDNGIVYLADSCYEISMIVDRAQALSIESGINRVIGFRPNTHDLIKDLLKGLDTKVLMVKIIELKNNTYFAKLIIKKGNLILSLDSRPSDALAIAARTDYLVPIYVNENLLKNVGRKIC